MPRATTSKTSAKKSSSTTATKRKPKTSSLLKSLPESVEHIEIVQQVAGVLEELQHRVLDVKEEASKELKKLMKRYESNYRTLEKKVHQVTSEAKKQAQTSMIHLLQKWHEHKEKLPKPLANEIEKIIDQIGTRMVAKPAAKRTKKTTAAKAAAAKTTKARKKKAASAKKGPKASVKAKTVRAVRAPSTVLTSDNSGM